MSNTLELINMIQAGHTRNMESAFDAIMSEKMEDAIELRHMEISQSMFQAVDESEQISEEEYLTLSEDEQELYELSKGTLKSYLKKAVKDTQKFNPDSDHPKYGNFNRLLVRDNGIDSAVDKLEAKKSAKKSKV